MADPCRARPPRGGDAHAAISRGASADDRQPARRAADAVALMIGESFGPFQVVAKLGEGGMGEVYRARDTRLNRDLALKVLPANVIADPERLARFTREAQVLASLNHLNIGGIYGLEQSGGRQALV